MCYDKAVVLVVSICVMQLAYSHGVDGSERAPEHKVWLWASCKLVARPGT